MWTDELTQKAATAYQAGMSASDVARMLVDEGYPVTRNAVIGRLSRTGMDDPTTRAHIPQGGRRLSISDVAPLRPARLEGHMNGAVGFKAIHAIKALAKGRKDPVDDLPAERPVCDGALHLSVTDLGIDTCHWPHGDGPFTFCGLPVSHGKPYCPHHCGIAYQPQERR